MQGAVSGKRSGRGLALGLVFLSLLPRVAALQPIFPCHSDIYCQGDLLRTVQQARLWPDSKHFVDMSLKVDPDEARRRFRELGPDPSREALAAFLNSTFAAPGEELESWTPPAPHSEPPFLAKLRESHLRQFALHLCGVWAQLGKKVRESVRENPQRYSLLYSPHPIIVPGGRFIEFYYWDTYWVVLGLLHCGLETTVRGILANFFHQVHTLGFVPNGGRRYFQSRSQPPLLAAMLEAYFRKTRDKDFLRQQLPLLEAEYNFWVMNRSLEVSVAGVRHSLARYAPRTNTPRPEAYAEDEHTARDLDAETAASLYGHIAAGAESGWDFSSRWFEDEDDDKADLSAIRAADIVPVDLNAILCQTEKLLSEFFEITGDRVRWRHYRHKWGERRQAMQAVLWEETLGVWQDWSLPSHSRRPGFFPSGLWPLATGCSHDNAPAERTLHFLEQGGWLSYPGGVPTSLRATGQQWDFPNAWPPLQHVTILALRQANTSRTRTAALKLAQKWTRANWLGFQQTGHMFEKYDATSAGRGGGGGEYVNQVGFGWTNGVVLDLMALYGDDLWPSEP